MLEANAISCVRGSRKLFSQLSFRVDGGTALRIRGRNGSGKTSLLRMVAGLSPTQDGSVSWQGTSLPEIGEEYAQQLVYVGHANALKDELSACENLRLGLSVHGFSASDDQVRVVLTAQELESAVDKPVQWLSAGQRRRVALARLWFSGTRKLWILDEPFSSLDDAAVARLSAQMTLQLASGGVILYTTHQDVELDAPCQTLELG